MAVAKTEAEVKKMTDADYDKLAKQFGAEARKEGTEFVKIPKQDVGEDIVPVIVNGYPWYVTRGVRTEVPKCVARVLEESGLI